jgi:hypothetical protein
MNRAARPAGNVDVRPRRLGLRPDGLARVLPAARRPWTGHPASGSAPPSSRGPRAATGGDQRGPRAQWPGRSPMRGRLPAARRDAAEHPEQVSHLGDREVEALGSVASDRASGSPSRSLAASRTSHA